MKTLIRLVLAAYIIISMIISRRIETTEIIVVLVLFVFISYNAKFGGNIATIIFMTVICGYLYTMNEIYFITFSFVVFDIMLTGRYYMHILPFASVLVINPMPGSGLYKDILLLVFSAVLGFAIRLQEKKEKQMYKMFDDERNHRYEIEKTQNDLMSVSREIRHSTTLRERNRIARDIHDNVGHRLAGSIIQIRAARKLMDIDPGKTKKILDEGITHLSDAMDLLRETVHNLKPIKSAGLEEINDIAKGFDYCGIELITSGDFNDEEPFFMSIMARNLKEALTNISKHSDAKKVQVRIETNPRYLRMTVKDDGTKRTGNIKEGLGLSGMRERLQNVGGSFSYGYSDGFVQANFIPREGKNE